MKVLVVGPSDMKSRGGMATVIRGIRNSKILNQKYSIDIFHLILMEILRSGFCIRFMDILNF